MKLFTKTNKFTIYNDSCLKMLEDIECNSIDSIVTDPPYELGFMGKAWDSSGIAFQKETWEKCYQVLKPGGYLLAFGGSRTFHRIACAIEDAGFEIRDTVMWLYGSGFPKSMNVGLSVDKKNGVESEIIGSGKAGISSRAYQSEETTTAGEYIVRKAQNEWAGWGTALKPAFEPVIVARKPCEGSTTDNILKYGVGGINIDECRVGTETITQLQKDMTKYHGNKLGAGHHTQMTGVKTTTEGRFPANLILTYDDSDYEEVCGGFPEGGKNGSIAKPYKMNNQVYGDYGYCNTWDAYNDSGSASRYFYYAKATKRDREEGLEGYHNVYKLNDYVPNEIVEEINSILWQ